MTKHLPPVTPGEILHEEYMAPLGLSANKLSEVLGVPPNRITGIINGTRGITANTALRLARCFGTSPEFWLNLQDLHDLEVARREAGKAIDKEVKPIQQVVRSRELVAA